MKQATEEMRDEAMLVACDTSLSITLRIRAFILTYTGYACPAQLREELTEASVLYIDADKYATMPFKEDFPFVQPASYPDVTILISIDGSEPPDPKKVANAIAFEDATNTSGVVH